MKITIYGAGKTGQYLTRVLTIEGHEVTVIEADPSVCNKLRSIYDISVIESRGIKREVFNPENLADCRLFIAVGPVDEMNIMACSIAKKIGASRTVARVRNEDYGMMDEVVDLRDQGIDLVIHPEKELSKELSNLVSLPHAIDVYELYGGKILILSTIVKENSKMVGKSLVEINSIFDLSNFRVVVVEKGLNAIIPRGDYIVKEKDKLYAVVDNFHVDAVFKLAGYKEEKNKDIMINGSGRIALTIARQLEWHGDFNIKVIVGDEDRATKFSEILQESLVVHGEATDIDILAAEGIIDTDFFLALTENDEINVVASLLANHLQVKKTITLIEKTDYIPITKTIGLQRCINSSVATSNAIMRFVRKGNVLATSTLKGIDIEVITYKITPNCRLVGKPLHKLKIPLNSIIGVIVRDGQTFVPTGGSIIQVNDEVVVFVEKSSVQEIGKLFSDA